MDSNKKKLNKKKVILLILILIVIIFVIVKLFLGNKQDTFVNEYEKVDKNQVSYKDNVTVEELKKDISATGDTKIYEIKEEFDGRKILSVKDTIKLKVSFAGIIKNSMPNLDEADEIFEKNFPKSDGIWVDENSREKILNLFNNSEVTNSKYYINDKGYLKIEDKNKQTDIDKKIEKIIKDNKKIVFGLSSVCYIVDDLTGEIMDYDFEQMDQMQSYKFFEDDNKMVVFITENKQNQLKNDEILKDLFSLVE